MADEDFYLSTAGDQLNTLRAERAQAVADLESARINGEYSEARAAVQKIANADAEIANLGALANRYVASQTPMQGPGLSKEMIASMSVEDFINSGCGADLLRQAGFFGDVSDQDFEKGREWARVTKNQFGR
jgi:hypothetical protein